MTEAWNFLPNQNCIRYCYKASLYFLSIRSTVCLQKNHLRKPFTFFFFLNIHILGTNAPKWWHFNLYALMRKYLPYFQAQTFSLLIWGEICRIQHSFAKAVSTQAPHPTQITTFNERAESLINNLKWHGWHRKCILISVLILALLVRFRVEFSVVGLFILNVKEL